MIGEKELDKSYDPKKVEHKWYDFWMEKGYFKADVESDRECFVIVIPPPNVTGKLHVGHALNNTLQDVIIRWRRMQGYDTLWLPGLDHGGIVTQTVLERDLASQGLSRHVLGRKEFEKRIWEWKEKSGEAIINQLKRLGCSCDWSRQRFTIDDKLSKAVRQVFVTLYHEGLIYRDKYIVNWCPRCRTALSDLEVEYQEIDGYLYYIRYPFKDEKGHIVVATTRPETILGDTAVAVNPKDKRYKKQVGKILLLPVIKRELPLIEDEIVDSDFGTGAVKVTPAHDPNDFLLGRKHTLEEIQVIDEDGRMNQQAGPYNKLDRFVCREKIVKDLKEAGFLEKIEEYSHSVGHCYRCQTIVEPYLSIQWFVKIKPLAEPAIKAVEKGKIKFYPPLWTKTYFEWMYNIRDWCISRQLWWGHRIPAWYCDDCEELTIAMEEPESCSHCQSSRIKQVPDVLDTWFSSALWPFSTLGWPEETKDLKRYYPTNVLVTGFDILFFWVARMIMMGLKFMGEVPFSQVYLNPLIRDEKGRKMSKSMGNIIDPLEMMNSYGTDAMRFTLTLMTVPGTDLPLSPKRMLGYRHFINKLWNAARFVLLRIADNQGRVSYRREELDLVSRWIKSRLSRIAKTVNSTLENFEFQETANQLYHFVWHEFCDWYLEMIKPVLMNTETTSSECLITQTVLIESLDTILRLLHPIIPYVTEELWQKLPGHGASIMIASFPEFKAEDIDEDAEDKVKVLMDLISKIRNIRSEMGIAPKKLIPLYLHIKEEEKKTIILNNVIHIKNLAAVKELNISNNLPQGEIYAKGIAENIEISIPLKELIDIDSERNRLRKEIAAVENELQKVIRKLNNQEFISNAPAEVVDKNREREENLTVKLETLKQSLENLSGS
jgi:valyl-tRNA synthetase